MVDVAYALDIPAIVQCTPYTDMATELSQSALRSSKAIHLFPGEHAEILGRLKVGWGKVVCWSTKAAISRKRVKMLEKLLRRGYSPI